MSCLKVFSCFCFGFEVGAADYFLALEGFFWMLYAHVCMDPVINKKHSILDFRPTYYVDGNCELWAFF
jgi:hypothetical protein